MAEAFGFPLDRAARLGVSLRAATDDDLPFLSALYATTRADELALTGWPEATRSLFAIHQFTAQHKHYAAEFPEAARAVILRRGEAIGRIYVDDRNAACHLIDITLMPAHCGQGLGAALIADLQHFAANRARRVTLSVLKGNPARRLYARLGFRETGRGELYDTLTWRAPRE